MSSDNPFAEPDDSDHMRIIRPVPGGRSRATPPVASAATTLRVTPPASVTGPDMVRVGSSPLIVTAAPLLQLLSRLRNTLSQPEPGDLRERAVGEVRRFEQASRDMGVPMGQLRPAHYALCASLDDVVQATPWGSQGAWATRSLVSTFHQEVRSGDRFFDVLNQVRQNPGMLLPVIELMYLCLSLGFQGRYRLSPRGPAELERLREETYNVITRQRPKPEPELAPHWRGISVPYKPVRADVPVWVLAVAGFAAVAGLFAWTTFGLNRESDALSARMMAAPPAQMPVILRAALVQPVPPSPPPPVPGAIDRLRGFLRSEIEQGLVAVVGTDAIPVVGIRNRGLFASGSAAVQSRFNALLERIGQALAEEHGPVQVIGYTDTQPIRSVRFPSNYQLSAARARAAADILGRTVGSAQRDGRMRIRSRIMLRRRGGRKIEGSRWC